MGGSITNLVPIRVEATSSNDTVHIIDTFLIDTTCLPLSHSSLSNNYTADFSIHSLIDANAALLAESIIADAEVYGADKSSKTHFGRLDLLSDKKLYQTVEDQIRQQLIIAFGADKASLLSSGAPLSSSGNGDEQITSSIALAINNQNHNVIRIKLRLRHENIAITDEFDYDMNVSGIDGFDPFSISKSIVNDLKLPSEFASSIATSIVEQMHGLNIPYSVEGMRYGKGVPAAFVLDVKEDGSAKDVAKYILNK